MKKLYISIIVLFLLLSVQQVFAGAGRITNVRIVGLLPEEPVVGTNLTFKVRLDDGKEFTHLNALQMKFVPETEDGGRAGEYRLTFNLSSFSEWSVGDIMSISVT